MNDKKRLNSYEDLPLVLDVADIQSGLWEFQERAPMSWYTHPAFQRSAGADLSRSAKLHRTGKRQISVRYHSLTCNTAALSKGAYRGKKT